MRALDLIEMKFEIRRMLSLQEHEELKNIGKIRGVGKSSSSPNCFFSSLNNAKEKWQVSK
jgi:hypothetical protein